MYLVHEEKLLDLSGDRSKPVELPASPFALAAHGPRAALLTPDLEVWRLEAGAWSHAHTLPGPSGAAFAAISANGALAAFVHRTPDALESDELSVLALDQPVYVDEPDFLQHITSLTCHPDGRSFGFGFLTSQPYSEWGSHGERAFGYVVQDTHGRIRRMTCNSRVHDEEPTLHGAWDPDGHLLATTIQEGSDLEAWDIEWARTLETHHSVMLMTVPDLADHVSHHVPAYVDTHYVVSRDGRTAATIIEGELVLSVREHWTTGGPASFVWGEEIVAVSLASWPTLVALRRDGRVLRARRDEVMTYAELLEG